MFLPKASTNAVVIGATKGISGTSGSILFIDASGNLNQNNAQLFWDNVNNRFGVGTATPSYGKMHIVDSDTNTAFGATYQQIPLGIRNSDTTDNNLVGIGFFGGTSASVAAQISAKVISHANNQSNLIFGTTTAGGAFGQKMFIQYDGSIGIATSTIGAGNTVQIGTQTSLSTATPVELSLGGTFSSVAASNLKFKFYDDGTTRIGVGISSGQYELITSAGTDFVFYSGTTKSMTLKSQSTNGDLLLVSKITQYNNIATVGGGVPAIYGTGRSITQTGDVASVATYTNGATDGSFIVSCNVLVTVFTAGTQSVQVTYQDEGGTNRTLTMNTSSLGGTLGTTIGATGAFEGVPLHIRVKASQAITIKTVGTVWNGTYNVEGYIQQIG